MKKVILILFVLTLNTTIFADTVLVNGIYYNLIEKGNLAEVAKSPQGYGGDIIIPDTIQYNGNKYSVVKITDRAFYNCGITSISMTNNIEQIGYSAFHDCDNLKSVTLSKKLKYIGGDAFANCDKIHSIYLPDELQTIVSYAFRNCTNLTSINIPSSVKYIGFYAFENTKIKSVYITELEAWCKIEMENLAFDSPIEHFYINNIETTEIDIPYSSTKIRNMHLLTLAV